MNTNRIVKVWDLPVRLFHWLLATAFFLAWFTEDDLMTLHVWAGYAVLSLILFRVVWGFAGTRYARFSNFLCSPSTAFAYLKDVLLLRAKRYLGHNPTGAMMIVLLLVGGLVTAVTGIVAYAADEGAGPLGGIVTRNGELWEEVHELAAEFTLFLVFLHVAGVVVESLLHRENLIQSMIDGNKRVEESAGRIHDEASNEQAAQR